MYLEQHRKSKMWSHKVLEAAHTGNSPAKNVSHMMQEAILPVTVRESQLIYQPQLRYDDDNNQTAYKKQWLQMECSAMSIHKHHSFKRS